MNNYITGIETYLEYNGLDIGRQHNAPSVADTNLITNPSFEVDTSGWDIIAPADYSTVVLADSPVAYWRLGETSGTSANDEVGSNDLTLDNTPTLNVAGAITGDANGAMLFAAASSESAHTTTLPTSATDNFALEAWVKLADLTPPTSTNIFAKVGNETGGWGFGVGDGNGNTGVALVVIYGGSQWLRTSFDFTDTNWHHVVMTRVSGTLRVYADGVLTTFETGTPTNAPLAPTGRFTVAGEYTGAVTNRLFDGSVDEVAVYATSLTLSQVEEHYETGLGQRLAPQSVLDPNEITGLARWFKADAITGKNDGDSVSQWDDSSGNAGHATQGTGANQPTYQTNELNGLPVLRFDGTNDFLGLSAISSSAQTVFVVAKQASAVAG
jgi:hypothetical protein